ncbi:MAG: VWA domain-containing protein [Myxococcales bacterium]|nr:VWA domain-containing protein [Myxococcales bacterium]
MNARPPPYSPIVRWALGFLALCLVALAPARAGAIGLLVPTDTSLAPLAIRSHRVDVQIRERVGETRVVQVFRNNTARQLEATYIFPLPPGATVSGFAMTVNGVRQEGQLLEAREARSIYEGIVARLQDPGLVEYMGGNLFRARVFPIPPQGDQTVEIRFSQTLEYQSSTLHFRYPLRTTGPQAQTLEDFSLRATIASRTAIRGVYSPTHRIDTTRRGEHEVVVGFEEGRAALNQDFDLYYTVADGDVGLSVLTHRPPGEDGYFLMMLAPRSEVTEREIIGKDLLFVVDTSGSMAGEKMDHARQALRAWVERLNPDDTFNILRFSTDVEPMAEQSLNASPENRQRALRFISSMEASGGTAIAPALRQALAVPTRRGAPRVVVFLTDGMPTIGETNTQTIIQQVQAQNGDRAQVFVFGLGDDVNTTFLDLLAQQNRGAANYARSGAEMSTLLAGFYNMIAFPVLADLRLAMRGAEAYDIYPRDLGTLYRGSQLVVTGRYRQPGEVRVGLTATVAGSVEPRTFEWPIQLAAREESNAFITRVWGTRKVGYLLDEIRLRGENPELRESVIGLARRFGIVTPYTSYLVTEDNAMRNQPVEEDDERPVSRGPMNRPAPPRPMTQPVPSDSPARSRGGANRDGDGFAAFQTLGGGRASAATGSSMGGGVAAAPSALRRAPVSNTTASAMQPGAPPPPPVQAMMPAAAPSPAPEATGEAGRRLALQMRVLRESERVNDGSGGTRFVAGRTFVLRNGAWEQEGLAAGGRVLRVRPLSRGYFSLVSARPELRAMLALGQRVRFALDAGRVIEVSPEAPDTSEGDVGAFLR